MLKNKEKAMLSLSSEQSENSYTVENLKSVIDSKDRHLGNLKERVKLHQYGVLIVFNLLWNLHNLLKACNLSTLDTRESSLLYFQISQKCQGQKVGKNL